MASIIPQRMAAQIEGDFVVFIIGARINRFWKVHKWLPVVRAMNRMIKELEGQPESGFLGYQSSGPVMVQYWRSFEALEAYARNRDQAHFPAWVAFNRANARARGDVGIWHETYRVRAGEYEAIYSGMPAYGLGKVASLVPATGVKNTARQRLGQGAPLHEPQLEAESVS